MPSCGRPKCRGHVGQIGHARGFASQQPFKCGKQLVHPCGTGQRWVDGEVLRHAPKVRPRSSHGQPHPTEARVAFCLQRLGAGSVSRPGGQHVVDQHHIPWRRGRLGNVAGLQHAHALRPRRPRQRTPVACPDQQGRLNRTPPRVGQATRQRFRGVEPPPKPPAPMRRHRHKHRVGRWGWPSRGHPTPKPLGRAGQATVLHSVQDLGGAPIGAQAETQGPGTRARAQLPQSPAAHIGGQHGPRQTASRTSPCHFVCQQQGAATPTPPQAQPCPPHDPKLTACHEGCQVNSRPLVRNSPACQPYLQGVKFGKLDVAPEGMDWTLPQDVQGFTMAEVSAIHPFLVARSPGGRHDVDHPPLARNRVP